MTEHRYFLKHTRHGGEVSAISFAQCQSDYYRSWRDEDGTIPFRMFIDSKQGRFELDPVTGDIKQ